MENKKVVGVITGDLIRSSALSSEQKNLVKSELTRFTAGNPDVQLPLQFYRGDSFQLMCTPEKAAWLTVMIQAKILSTVGTLARISIGIGAVSKITEGNVLQSDGEAFQLSGHQMDKMKDEGRLMKIAIASPLFQPILAASFYLAESIISGWKPGQATVISMIPGSKTQKEMAEKLNITEAAVSKALKSGKWAAIDDFLKGYEKTIKEI